MDAKQKFSNVLLIASLILLGFSSVSFGTLGKSVPNPEDLITSLDPTAPGTKWAGELYLYYEVIPNVIGCDLTDEAVDMHIFTRVRQGSNLYAFGGVVEALCYKATETHEAELFSWFEGNVIPQLAGTANASFGLKSVDQLVQDGVNPNMDPGDGTPANPFFIIMDIVIAIVD